MAINDNLDLVRRGYAAFSAGDMETLQQIFAADIVHSVPGSSTISGDHKGPQEVLSMYGQLFERSAGTMKVDLETVLSDGGDRVIAIHTATASREGKSQNEREALLFTIADGKVTEIVDFFGDIDANDAFWG